jgi:hypothetical protein
MHGCTQSISSDRIVRGAENGPSRPKPLRR